MNYRWEPPNFYLKLGNINPNIFWNSRMFRKTFPGNIIKIMCTKYQLNWKNRSRYVKSCTKIRTKWDEIKVATTNFGQKCTIDNWESDKQRKFEQNRTMLKGYKLREKYRALWHPSQKWEETTNFGKKSTIENYQRNMHWKFH